MILHLELSLAIVNQNTVKNKGKSINFTGFLTVQVIFWPTKKYLFELMKGLKEVL